MPDIFSRALTNEYTEIREKSPYKGRAPQRKEGTNKHINAVFNRLSKLIMFDLTVNSRAL